MKAKEKDRKPKCQSVRQMPMGRKCKQGTWRHAEHGNRRLNVRGMSVSGFIFLGFKITADSDFSHEIKKCLLLGCKTMTNQDSILKSKDITLLTKVHIGKAMAFPVVKYGCESWTIKKAEC